MTTHAFFVEVEVLFVRACLIVCPCMHVGVVRPPCHMSAPALPKAHLPPTVTCYCRLRHMHPPTPVVASAAGHVPMLADPTFAAMVEALGRASLGASDKAIWHLIKVYCT